MSGMTIGRGVAVLAVGAALVLAGCESTSEPESESSTTSASTNMQTEAPTAYNPCTDVPQEILDAEKLKMPREQTSSVSGIEWQGCMWVQSDGYAATIQTSNISVDMVIEKNLLDTRELEIAGRRSVSSRRVEDHSEAVCTVNVEIVGGSLEFNLSNPPSRKNTGHLDT
ncbi:MAG TPA: DUF3558 domain-containing protein, partial [Nocardia sp.]|nr:DUF3558 domain-containing protein [Nocardia sp.]